MTGEQYFNEIDPFAAEWLGNLFPAAAIDQRSIVDVTAADLVQYKRAHFFSGIGGWELALRLAGWPFDRPVDSGSCPCQPYSQAGKGEADEDPRNLWPAWLPIIRERRPECLVGEQVANAIGHGWLDGIFADLEAEDYTCGAIVLGAHSIRRPHVRQRLWWMAYTSGAKRRWRAQPQWEHGRAFHLTDRSGNGGLADSGHKQEGWAPRCSEAESGGAHRQSSGCGINGGVANSAGLRGSEQWDQSRGREASGPPHAAECSGSSGLGNSVIQGPQGFGPGARSESRSSRDGQPATTSGSGGDFGIVHCRDGKSRRIEPGSFPLAHGIPADLGRVRARLEGMGLSAKTIKRLLRNPRSLLAVASRNRVGRLRGYGNAIVPEVAAEFLQMVMEILST